MALTRTCSILLILLTLATAAPAQSKRNITEKDLFAFQWIGDTQLSPDATRVAFVKITVNAKHDDYETSLWLLNLNTPNTEPTRLTTGPRDSSPRWSPDGQTLAFVRATEKDNKPQPAQIFLLPLVGGEPRSITTLVGGAGNPSFSPDGKHLLFSSNTSPEDIEKAEKKKTAPPDPNEHESDVRIITKAVYRFNGAGYLDGKHPNHLWVMPVPAANEEPAKPTQLTKGRFNEGDAQWAPDSTAIYFTTDKVDEPYYELPHTEIDRIAITGGDPTTIAKLDLGASEISISPDGKRVVFHASVNKPIHSYTQPDLWVMDLTPNATPRNLTTGYDFDIGAGVFGDNEPPRAAGNNQPIWDADGKSVLDTAGKEGTTNLIKIDTTTGKVTEFSRGNQDVNAFSASRDGNKVIARISTAVNIDDLFTVAPDGTQQQLTHINDKLFSQLNLTQPEEIWFNSFDGKRIQMWVQRPPNYDAHKKYPLILDIHGGPHAAYGWVFEHEFQWMAAKGYVVVYPNPRGSTTYGQDFGNIIQYHYPGDDYRDLMLAVDEVIKRGGIDSGKLGATGGSGGGVLTDWIVTHTNRFKAAVSQRDISDWTSWWYTDDFTLFQPSWFKDAPFNNPEDFSSRSAITFVKNIQTPMMFILGETDYRTPPAAGGEQLFRALKFMHEPTVMVRFPGENHELSRSGQPWHRVERLENIVGWFDKYLDGISKPEYDIVPGILPQPVPHEYKGEPASKQ